MRNRPCNPQSSVDDWRAFDVEVRARPDHFVFAAEKVDASRVPPSGELHVDLELCACVRLLWPLIVTELALPAASVAALSASCAVSCVTPLPGSPSAWVPPQPARLARTTASERMPASAVPQVAGHLGSPWRAVNDRLRGGLAVSVGFLARAAYVRWAVISQALRLCLVFVVVAAGCERFRHVGGWALASQRVRLCLLCL